VLQTFAISLGPSGTDRAHIVLEGP